MIKIYDTAFSAIYVEKVFNMIVESNYRLGWKDNVSLEHAHNVTLHSKYSVEDVAALGILEELKNHDVGGLVNLDKLKVCVINLTSPGQTHIEHTHPGEDVILYYASPTWNRWWAGETLFYSDDGVEIEKAIEYIPNRLIFFNGWHPHTIRPPSFEATFYRFTITLIFQRE